MNRARLDDDIGEGGGLARLWPLMPMIFLPNLAGPLAALLRAHPRPLHLGLVLIGLAIFIVVYLWASWQNDVSQTTFPGSSRQRVGPWHWLPMVLLASVSVTFIVGDGPRWLSMLIFTSACAGGRFALAPALRTLTALAALTALLGLLAHDTWSDLAAASFWTAMAGILTIIMTYLRRTNRALRDAREEIARLAVESERLRFARDLHDLLGHDLARIALQSEVAEALAPTTPDQAMAAMHEVGVVARTALQEVRAAVAGYRQPTLASELRGAGELLAAAAITYRREGVRVAVPPAVEAVLAWAVREGVTNVVRHSHARQCTICTAQDEASAGIEVIDDGTLATEEPAPLALQYRHGGSGLRGLAERAAALGGRCEAGPSPGGGFRLAITLPVANDGGTGASAAQSVGSAVMERGGRR